MATPIPQLNLTHGQVTWAVCRGLEPSTEIIDQIRYFRALGVPFDKTELGKGRGNRLRYSFDQLIELGVALAARKRGLKPTEAATYIVDRRKSLRSICRTAFSEQPAEARKAEWVKSRGKSMPILGGEIFLRFHDSVKGKTGKLDTVTQQEMIESFTAIAPGVLALFGLLAEHHPSDGIKLILPITRLTLELVAWAEDAPEIKTGPQ